jgi:signal transduction histidine kinase
MAALIDGLLELSRMSRAELKPEPVNLSAVLRASVAQLAAAEPERQVELVVEDGLTAEIDPRLAYPLLDNLAGNAWKFTGKVGRARIEFGALAEDGRRVFFVNDNGAGFDMAFAKKLFAPFQRLHTTREFPGTGIGLAGVQRIIRRHGGEIWAEGRVGEGATFYFTLPDASAGDKR